jgi:hypothetical protein
LIRIPVRNLAVRPSGSKKCLQKTPQCETFTALKGSEAAEGNGTYWYFRSRTSRRG